MISNEKFKLVLFLIYTILYECLIWGLVAASIYYLHWYWLIIIVGIIMSGAQFKPWHFGLKYERPESLKDDDD